MDFLIKRNLNDLEDEALYHLPPVIFLHWASDEVHTVWERLPPELQQREDFQQLRLCYEHYNKGRTHIDGPPPPKKHCRTCYIQKETLH